jgi:L-ascorbate metabolism protein UlaG (beta-lactamase superfamily)
VAGIERGANAILVFECDDLRICHFGDFGQAALRPEQERAIGRADLLFIPVGGEYTIGGKTAAAITKRLAPRLVVPVHYRTPKLDWPVESADAFVAEFDSASVVRLKTSEFELLEHASNRGTTVLVPAVP